jgi:transcriptional regulator with PAS, ATPase and Fis domain
MDEAAWGSLQVRATDGDRRRMNGASSALGAVPRGAPLRRPVTSQGDFHGVVGRSPAMQQVFEQIRRAAAGRGPVLITGETGTGKELVARAMHKLSPRRTRPFVAVNCAALPRELIESELFGYQRGAFSGALAEHPGLLRAAAGGTVLLDEITEMSPELQAKLLRVVQEHSVRPVGSIVEIPVDVRFIASTNRDLDAVLASGLLRPDLYYRLAVSEIALPPLRARGDDLVLLVEHHLAALNQHYADTGVAPRGIACDAVEALLEHSWPGNVRELFNVLERAFLASPAAQIRRRDLSQPRSTWETAAVAPSPARSRATYAESERAVIARALVSTGGNKARAARELGISRKRLYARIAKYGL